MALVVNGIERSFTFKKGNETKNYECREFIRIMDKLSEKSSLQKWTPLGNGVKGNIKVILNETSKKEDATKIFGSNKEWEKYINYINTSSQEQQ